MITRTIPAQTHGRYLIDVPAGPGPFPLLIGFHGYGEGAGAMMEELLRIRGERQWLAASVQALEPLLQPLERLDRRKLDDARGS